MKNEREDSLVRVDEVLPGDTLEFRSGGSAIVKNVEHKIGAGIGHRLNIETEYGFADYSCTGEAYNPALDVIKIVYTEENKDKKEFDEAFCEVFGRSEKDEALKGKCRILYFKAKGKQKWP